MKSGAWEGFRQALDKAAAFGQAAAHTAVAGARVAATKVTQEVVGAKCLLDYSVEEQVACGGPAGLWKIYLCRSRKPGSPNSLVSAWILDKRELQQEQGHGGGSAALTRPSARRLEQFLEQARHDVQQLARLKHPSVLRLVGPLEETRTQLVFLTEPLFCSLGDLLHANRHGLPQALAQERAALQLSVLEIKHGLLQVAEGLHWLGADAGLAHRGVCPDNVLITQTGQWKLAGFGFSTALDFASGGGGSAKPLDYSEPMPSLLQLATQPPLPYTAPELVAPGSAPIITPAADVFSLGALTLELTTRRQLLPVGNRLAEYESRVHSLALVEMTGVPFDLEQTLRQMIAAVPGARPPAAAFAACQWLQGDVQLRALRFLDSMLQRDSLQKAAFLKDLPAMCAHFDSRVLRFCVLPPLLGELRSTDLLPALLPVVLKIVALQPPADFNDITLPALTPLLQSATGDALLLLVQHAELLGKAGGTRAGPGGGPPPAARLLPALLVRAAEQGDSRTQEEMLRQCGKLADSLDYEGLKQQVLPAVHSACLSTTSAAVRVSAFAALSRLAGRVDQQEAEKMVELMGQVTSVDKTASTCMCVLALGEALAKQWGPRMAAERILPVLAPLLVAPTLNSQQFHAAMKAAREILGAVEKARGVDGGAGAGGGSTGTRSVGSSHGGTPRAAAEPSSADWLAATSMAPPAATRNQSYSQPQGLPTASGSGNGSSNELSNGLLSGMVVQQPAAAAPAAAPFQTGFGTGSSWSVGSGKPLTPALASALPQPTAAPAAAVDPFAWPPPGAAAPAVPAAAALPARHAGPGSGNAMAGWQASSFGASSNSGGVAASSNSGGFAASSATTAAAATDPFAGLELSRPATGAGSMAAPTGLNSTGSSTAKAAAAPDPFDLLVSSHRVPPSGGSKAPGGMLGAQRWPQQQQGSFGGQESLI